VHHTMRTQKSDGRATHDRDDQAKFICSARLKIVECFIVRMIIGIW